MPFPNTLLGRGINRAPVRSRRNPIVLKISVPERGQGPNKYRSDTVFVEYRTGFPPGPSDPSEVKPEFLAFRYFPHNHQDPSERGHEFVSLRSQVLQRRLGSVLNCFIVHIKLETSKCGDPRSQTLSVLRVIILRIDRPPRLCRTTRDAEAFRRIPLVRVFIVGKHRALPIAKPTGRR